MAILNRRSSDEEEERQLEEEYQEDVQRRRGLGLPPNEYPTIDELNNRDFSFGIDNCDGLLWDFYIKVGSGRKFTYSGNREQMIKYIARLENAAQAVRESISLKPCPICGEKVRCEAKHLLYPFGVRFRCQRCDSSWDFHREYTTDRNGVYRSRFGLVNREEACRWWDVHQPELVIYRERN